MMSGVSLTDSRRDEQVPASPPATRHRGSTWRDPRLLVGVVLVAGSALAGATLLSGDETVDVWAVSEGLAAGEPLRTEALVRREVRFTDQADADRYLSADEPLPSGTALARDVGAGELVPRAALTGDEAAPVVEVPLGVAGEAVPATVGTGSRVDVWVTTGLDGTGAAADGSEPARLVLADVRVLAVSRGGAALGAAAPRQVIVAVEADQEDELSEALAAMAAGEVVLVRRP